MLVEPAQSLTDLLLGVVAVGLAVQLRRRSRCHPHWQAAFWWFGGAALAGAVYHGVLVGSPDTARASWAVVSVAVVVAVSYLLAGTVAEVLGPGRMRAFWLLRSVGVVAYVIVAASGRAGIDMILICESGTMVSMLALWLWAAYRRHPLAPPMLFAVAASGAAATANLISPELLKPVDLDPTSLYHLAQLAGIVLLYLAVSGYGPVAAADWSGRPGHRGTRTGLKPQASSSTPADADRLRAA
jgi:Family of unknown function (DUF6962)